MTSQEFSLAVRTHFPSLSFLALRLTHHRQDAQDLVQETIIQGFLNRGKFTVGTDFRSWTCSIMRYTYNNSYRKQKTRRKLNLSIEYSISTQRLRLDVSNSGEQDLLVQDIEGTIVTLSEIYRLPLTMFYRGYSYQEIAAQLNIPMGTVKSRICTARQKLKISLVGRHRIAAPA